MPLKWLERKPHPILDARARGPEDYKGLEINNIKVDEIDNPFNIKGVSSNDLSTHLLHHMRLVSSLHPYEKKELK